MSPSHAAHPTRRPEKSPLRETLLKRLRAHLQATREVRRGVCLLNAGEFEQAAACFSRAASLGLAERSLPAYLAACLLGQGRAAEAAEEFGRMSHRAGEEAVPRIRKAWAFSAAGKREQALDTLRIAVGRDPECAELHFQLGVLLASMENFEEAELRFTQAVNIDRNHAGALVNLALCRGMRGAPGEALGHLQRAQRQSPHDPRIGLLLAQAAGAHREAGHLPNVRADMPGEGHASDRRGIIELSRVIEAEPDFVDAFLSLSEGEVDRDVFAMLLQTIRTALERQPEHAELHYHCGRVLDRLGRPEDAITENERAVAIDPRFTRAMIELGRLYHRTDRTGDAATRLEQAVAAGAEYADVFYLLGNLYRDRGEVGRARSAYRRALLINDGYQAALKALASLPA